MKTEVLIEETNERNRECIREWIAAWPAPYIISRGRKLWPAELDGLVAFDSEDKLIGLLTYEVVGDQCEVVTLDALTQWSGIGTQLLNRAITIARETGCRRLWLITTNDNIEAIRFYQRRGLTLAAVHVNALEHSRTLKPEIPEIGLFGIPMRDEIEFEMGL